MKRHHHHHLLSALRARETGTHPAPSLHDAAYLALVPSSTFVNVTEVPNVTFRRFTPCGTYLLSLSRNNRHLVVFRVEGGGKRSMPTREGGGRNDVRKGCDMFESTPYVAMGLFEGGTFDPFAEEDIMGEGGSQAGWLTSSLQVPLRVSAAMAHTNEGQERASAASQAPIDSDGVSSEQPFSCSFNRFFTRLYEVPIATGTDSMAREFCLCTPQARYVILASYLVADGDAAEARAQNEVPAVAGCPVLQTFTLHLVRVRTGVVTDRFCISDDFVALEGHAGVHMYGDLLVILGVRRQTLYFVRVQEGQGRFVREMCVGDSCRPDDGLEIARAREAERAYNMERRGGGRGVPVVTMGVKKETERRVRGGGEVGFEDEEGRRMPLESGPSESGLGNGKMKTGFYTGVMQRLLAYVYRRLLSQRNESVFYRVVAQYSMLVMQKVQFLDEDHLLVRLGSYKGSRKNVDVGNSTCFFLVYCISTTRIVNLFENRSVELLAIYDRFRDEFTGDYDVANTHVAPRNVEGEGDARMGGMHGGGGGGRDRGGDAGWGRGLRRRGREGMRGGGGGGGTCRAMRTRKALGELPVSCQMCNVSPYLDRRLFSYDVERLGALNGTRPMSLRELNSVKFTSVRGGGMRFKLAPGMPERVDLGRVGRATASGGRSKKRVLFLFHPFFPFVMSMQCSTMLPTLLNFHVYGHGRHA